MTERELEVLNIIKDNPSVSLTEISEKLGISRNTAGVYISNLTKSGYLLGRAYVINADDYIVGIGAANVDLYGKSSIAIRKHFDHPGKIRSNLGGVSRNVIENLTRLGMKTKMLTAVGDDLFGSYILSESARIGIDMKEVLTVQGSSSSIFMQVLDDQNDMHLAVCDMTVISNIDKEYLSAKDPLIRGAKAVVFDPSLPEESIEYLLDNYPDKMIFVDPVSDVYAAKIRPYISRIYALKPNLSELKVLSGKEIGSKEELIDAGRSLIEQGVRRLFVSLGKDGCMYMDNDDCYEMKFAPAEHVVNASGAGDAFFAGVIYGLVRELDVREAIKYGLAAGIITINCAQAINPELSIDALKRIIKENEK